MSDDRNLASAGRPRTGYRPNRSKGTCAALLHARGGHRIEAHTDVSNIAEQRALEGAGFTREGLVRGAQWRAGAYRDGYLYAILRGDVATEGVAKRI